MTGALVGDRPIPLEAAGIEGREDRRCRAGLFARRVDIINTYVPAAAPVARIEVAREGRDDGPEMQRSGRRGGETPDRGLAGAGFTRCSQRVSLP
tara:strand:- start:2014 stop:2298 length:285 start_codon:yes stop_codon:yes gene_type:complete